VYLTPSAPKEAGTAFFCHRQSGLNIYPTDPSIAKVCDDDAPHWDRWELTDRVANFFNRLVLFRGERFHASQSHFGDSKENGRLFQVFFFSTAF
jgi:hypothetical protein